MSEREVPYTVIVGVSATSKSPTALVWGHAQAKVNDGRLIAPKGIGGNGRTQRHRGGDEPLLARWAEQRRVAAGRKAGI